MRRLLLGSLYALTAACASLGFARAGALSTPDYPLDEVSRAVDPGEKLPCEKGELELVPYKGDLIRYEKPVRVHPAFKAQLVAFEGIVDELAREHFGRPPRRIHHLGAYNCRPMRNYAHWMSEHALGNALDVSGFDFGPLPKKAEAPPELAKKFYRPFQVRVDKHWEASEPEAPKRIFFAHPRRAHHRAPRRVSQRRRPQVPRTPQPLSPEPSALSHGQSGRHHALVLVRRAPFSAVHAFLGGAGA